MKFLKDFLILILGAIALVNSSARVKWGFSGKMNYPYNSFLICMNPLKLTGTVLQGGLNSLNALHENNENLHYDEK